MELNVVLIIGLFILATDIVLRFVLHRNEIRFKQKKFEEEKDIWQKKMDWMKNESANMKELAEPIAVNLKEQLMRDTSWLSASLHQAKIGSDSKTVFNDRLGHFQMEKRVIMEQFIPLLLERCKHHIEHGNRKVCLLIDSGTTLFEFFEKFSEECVRLYNVKEKWLDELLVATNNLPGVQVAMEKGRINPNDRFSEMAFKCHLFQGSPLAIYAAITGKETDEAITTLKNKLKSNSEEVLFIGITVGNWVRIRRSEPQGPIPMVRGEGHSSFKQALLENCDEIFVISPLGKIFLRESNPDINSALGLSVTTDPHKEAYKDVNITREMVKKIKLVTTGREEKRILYKHSLILEKLLKFYPYSNINISSESIEKMDHIRFNFDELPEYSYFEKETEFPHKSTRKPEFMKRFFHVSMNP